MNNQLIHACDVVSACNIARQLNIKLTGGQLVGMAERLGSLRNSAANALRTTPAHQRLTHYAVETGNDKLLKYLACGARAMPSIEELNVEFGCQAFEQDGGIVIVHRTDDSTATGALYKL